MNIPDDVAAQALAADDSWVFIAEWALEEAARAIEASTTPDGRYGSLNDGSRSQWFSKGLREASRRVWALRGNAS